MENFERIALHQEEPNNDLPDLEDIDALERATRPEPPSVEQPPAIKGIPVGEATEIEPEIVEDGVRQ